MQLVPILIRHLEGVHISIIKAPPHLRHTNHRQSRQSFYRVGQYVEPKTFSQNRIWHVLVVCEFQSSIMLIELMALALQWKEV